MQHPAVTAEKANELNELSGKVIGAGIEVHRNLGPGLREAVYEDCLGEEIAIRDIAFERQVWVPVVYKANCWDRDTV